MKRALLAAAVLMLSFVTVSAKAQTVSFSDTFVFNANSQITSWNGVIQPIRLTLRRWVRSVSTLVSGADTARLLMCPGSSVS